VSGVIAVEWCSSEVFGVIVAEGCTFLGLSLQMGALLEVSRVIAAEKRTFGGGLAGRLAH
jgi:hypothetical protein